MGIGSLNVANPGSGEVAGTSGPAEIKALKSEIQGSFPAFTAGNDVVSRTATQINNAPDKTATEVITGAWNFTGTTLQRNGAAVATESYVITYNAAILVNDTAVPGVWNFVNGLQSSGLTVATQAWVSASAGVAACGGLEKRGDVLTGSGAYQTILTWDTASPALGATLNAANGTVTITSAGTYRVSFTVNGEGSGLSAPVRIRINRNGAGETSSEVRFTPITTHAAVSHVYFANLLGGDVIRLEHLTPNTETWTVTNASLTVDRII
jgi:hypothetical protein